MLEWQRRGFLEHVDREIALNVLHARKLEQFLEYEAAIALEIGHHDLQQKIALTRQDPARRNFWHLVHARAETFRDLVAVPFEIDRYEHQQVEAHARSIHARCIA